jgi:hypothetical protein
MGWAIGGWLRRWLPRFALCAALPLAPATAQQRSVVNPGFEQNDPSGPGTPNYQILPSASVPGWESTTSEIELWDSGFNGVPSYEGNVHAEMNANSPGTLYQNVCFVNGEVIRWSFAHRARSGGLATQTVRFQVANSSGTVIQTLATQASTVASNAWSVNTSPLLGTVYTGPTGVQRLQFSTEDLGSFGNFLDGIRIFLSPYLELNGTVTSATEGAASPTLPAITISGEVTSTTTVTVNVTGGTATRGTDYTTPNGLATFTVTIPAGNYDRTQFPLGLAIINDSTIEANETIQLAIVPLPGSYTVASTGTCGSAATTTMSHTIIDDDSRLTLRKQWANALAGDDATLTLARGATVVDTLVSDAGSANELDTDPTPAVVAAGEVLTIAETFPGSNVGSYGGVTTCTGASDTNLADGLVLVPGETAVTCTITNTYRPPLIVSKLSSPFSDPANGTTNPKMIPGGFVTYTVNVAAPSAYSVTGDTLSIVDSLPAGVALFVGNLGGAGSGPVGFTPASSTLSFTFATLSSTADDLDFSNNGGSTWTYAPVADANGTDGAVTHLRVRPRGVMAAGSSFQLSLRARIR